MIIINWISRFKRISADIAEREISDISGIFLCFQRNHSANSKDNNCSYSIANWQCGNWRVLFPEINLGVYSQRVAKQQSCFSAQRAQETPLAQPRRVWSAGSFPLKLFERLFFRSEFFSGPADFARRGNRPCFLWPAVALGCPFFWWLFFGQAKKRHSPAGAKHNAVMYYKKVSKHSKAGVYEECKTTTTLTR